MADKDNKSLVRHYVGIALILAAVVMLIFDYFSPPVGELSNFTLIVFAKIVAVAGSLMNISFKALSKTPDAPTTSTAKDPEP